MTQDNAMAPDAPKIKLPKISPSKKEFTSHDWALLFAFIAMSWISAGFAQIFFYSGH